MSLDGNTVNFPLILSMEIVDEKEPEWLVPQCIPKGQITIAGGDGGSGKTTFWCSVAAAVSSGKKVFFEDIPMEFTEREPQRVLFFSSEDSLEYTLRARLRKAGADLRNIFTVSLKDKRFSEIKFNSPLLEEIILQIKPALVIFDPIQSFIPRNVSMSQRNEMRDCLNPLIGLGEKFGVTSLIIIHTNKRSNTYGRYRLSDSADIWDIARSVLIIGQTQDSQVRYVSHEKSNYGEPMETVLFSIEDGVASFKGFSDKHDIDFVKERDLSSYQAPQRQDAEDFIIDFLKNGKKLTKDLDDSANAFGISKKTMERAKTELRKKGILGGKSEGFGRDKLFYSFLLAPPSP